MATGVHRRRCRVRRPHRSHGAATHTGAGAADHCGIRRAARLLRRLSGHVSRGRGVRTRRSARIHRRPQGGVPLVHRQGTGTGHGHLHHRFFARPGDCAVGHQQRVHAPDGRQLALCDVPVRRHRARSRPRLVCNRAPRHGTCDGAPACRRTEDSPDGDVRRPDPVARSAAHPADEHRDILLQSRPEQLAAGDPALGRDGRKERRILGRGAHGSGDRRRTADTATCRAALSPFDPGGPVPQCGGGNAVAPR